jgi:hypothetical protein
MSRFFFARLFISYGLSGRTFVLLCLIISPIFITVAFSQKSTVESILDRCNITVNSPKNAENGFFTMDHSPVMGNGCLMITTGSTSNSLTFYLGKTDFWRDKCNEPENDGWQSANVLPGRLKISFPTLEGSSFNQTQNLRLAEVLTTMTKGISSVTVRSVTPHPADNYLIQEVTNTGKQIVDMIVETSTDQYRIPTNPFEIQAGKSSNGQQVMWVTRKTNSPPTHDDYGSREFRMWAAIGTRILGKPGRISVKSNWSYKAGDGEVRVTSTVGLLPGEKRYIVTKVHSTGIPVTMNPANPLPPVLKELSTLDPSFVEKLISNHHDWWKEYWNKSYIDLKEELLVERVYYGALYVFACANKPGQWPAGCNGWPINDEVPWGGDYHWNYNNQAVYYGAFSSNRIELTETYDRTVNEANIFSLRHAQKLGVPGTVFFVATAPGHLNEAQTIGQRTHAIEAALNQINHWYYTFDMEWMKSNYSFLKDVANYWDFDLQKNRESLPNGNYRYVVVNSAPMEGADKDKFNGITGIAFLKRFYKAMIDITNELNANGYNIGKNEKDIMLWSDFLSHMSDYPKSFAYGRKVFAWSEESLNPLLTEQDWILYPVFPAEQVGMESNRELLNTARNTLIIKPQYYVEWLNNPTQIFSIAARLAHHPPEILERLKYYYNDLGVSNFKSGGSNTENTAIIESVNSMLIQSHEGFIRLFPCWDLPAADFVQLRTVGAFLVNASKKNGVVQPLTIYSEKGKICKILNPWKGSKVIVKDINEQVIQTKIENTYSGELACFETKPGMKYRISAIEQQPDSLPYWNAALYKKVITSSDFQPFESNGLMDANKFSEMARLSKTTAVLTNQIPNWSANKLTDGTRINTRAGNRGWTSNLHEKPDNTEWVQIDLGELAEIKRIDLWPLDHGDAWQHTHCTEPFVNSGEIDQSFDGFPYSFTILVSTDGEQWKTIAEKENYYPPASNVDASEQKPKDITGPESFTLKTQSVRYIKVVATKLRKTRYFEKYAMQLAEIEVVRN